MSRPNKVSCLLEFLRYNITIKIEKGVWPGTPYSIISRNVQNKYVKFCFQTRDNVYEGFIQKPVVPLILSLRRPLFDSLFLI